MKGVKIPCLYLEGEALRLKNLDIEVPMEASIDKDVKFYNIDGLNIYEEQGIEYTEILCNGAYYLTRLPFSKVEKLFDEL